jgi:hypothetical protein
VIAGGPMRGNGFTPAAVNAVWAQPNADGPPVRRARDHSGRRDACSGAAVSQCSRFRTNCAFCSAPGAFIPIGRCSAPVTCAVNIAALAEEGRAARADLLHRALQPAADIDARRGVIEGPRFRRMQGHEAGRQHHQRLCARCTERLPGERPQLRDRFAGVASAQDRVVGQRALVEPEQRGFRLRFVVDACEREAIREFHVEGRGQVRCGTRQRHVVGDQQQAATALHPVAHRGDLSRRKGGGRGRRIRIPVGVARLRVGDDQRRARGQTRFIEGGTVRRDHVAVAAQQRAERTETPVQGVEIVVRLVQADHRALAFGERRRRYGRREIAICHLLRHARQAGGQQQNEAGDSFHAPSVTRHGAPRMCRKARMGGLRPS